VFKYNIHSAQLQHVELKKHTEKKQPTTIFIFQNHVYMGAQAEVINHPQSENESLILLVCIHLNVSKIASHGPNKSQVKDGRGHNGEHKSTICEQLLCEHFCVAPFGIRRTLCTHIIYNSFAAIDQPHKLMMLLVTVVVTNHQPAVVVVIVLIVIIKMIVAGIIVIIVVITLQPVMAQMMLML
jgi:hypothetical protein